MKIKTSELKATAQSRAVAKCEGIEVVAARCTKTYLLMPPVNRPSSKVVYEPSIDWAQGGPILEREGISLRMQNFTTWFAGGNDEQNGVRGPTPLIAAMRCYVASKLGNEVEVPDELM